MFAVSGSDFAFEDVSAFVDFSDEKGNAGKFLVEDSEEGQGKNSELTVLSSSNKFYIWVVFNFIELSNQYLLESNVAPL